MPSRKQADACAAIHTQLDGWRATGDAAPLAAYLAAHSNLPGPRGNLELAWGFADALAARDPAESADLWTLCTSWAAIPVERAPVNDPGEFVVFCGVLGLGALAVQDAARLPDALEGLRNAAQDDRWRLREAVAMGLQRLLGSHPRETMAALGDWTDSGAPLILRAVAAGVADPPLLKADPVLAAEAVELHRRILAWVVARTDRRSEPFRVLRQGLSYSLSVVVAGCPVEGFALLEDLLADSDPDVRRIVAENLKKSRLVKPFPAQVSALTARL